MHGSWKAPWMHITAPVFLQRGKKAPNQMGDILGPQPSLFLCQDWGSGWACLSGIRDISKEGQNLLLVIFFKGEKVSRKPQKSYHFSCNYQLLKNCNGRVACMSRWLLQTGWGDLGIGERLAMVSCRGWSSWKVCGKTGLAWSWASKFIAQVTWMAIGSLKIQFVFFWMCQWLTNSLKEW